MAHPTQFKMIMDEGNRSSSNSPLVKNVRGTDSPVTVGRSSALASKEKAPARADDGPETRSAKRQRLMHNELRLMLYGFGDVENPLPETLDAVEDCAMEFMHSLIDSALQVSARRGKLNTEDFLFAVRKDPAKYKRGKELLRLNEIVTRVRDEGKNKLEKTFDQDE